MFLNDRPDISVVTGMPLVYPSLLNGACVVGDCYVFRGNVLLERFYVPFGESQNGFTLKAYVESFGSPSALFEAIYPDNSSVAWGSPLLDKPLANLSVSGVGSTPNWVSTTFHSVNLVGGDYYWVAFTSNGASSNANNYFGVASDQQSIYPDIQVWVGGNGVTSAVQLREPQYCGCKVFLDKLSRSMLT